METTRVPFNFLPPNKGRNPEHKFVMWHMDFDVKCDLTRQAMIRGRGSHDLVCLWAYLFDGGCEGFHPYLIVNGITERALGTCNRHNQCLPASFALLKGLRHIWVWKFGRPGLDDSILHFRILSNAIKEVTNRIAALSISIPSDCPILIKPWYRPESDVLMRTKSPCPMELGHIEIAYAISNLS